MEIKTIEIQVNQFETLIWKLETLSENLIKIEKQLGRIADQVEIKNNKFCGICGAEFTKDPHFH